MPQNQIKPWAIGSGANTLDPITYANRNEVQLGVQNGIGDPVLANTTWRQSSFIAAMVGQFIADNQANDVLDNGNITTLEAQFKAALASALTANTITLIYKNRESGYQGYTAAGTYSWTVPAGVYFVAVELAGAGGGGAGANGNRMTSGGAGGAGGTATSVLPVTPGDILSVIIGAGGSAGPSSNSTSAGATAGGNGGSTTLSNPGKWTVTCGGGSAGVDTSPGSGGSGGGAGFGGAGYSGGYGSPGFALVSGAGSPPYAYGGTGGANYFGGGGASIYLNPGSTGRSPGTGGGGGMIYPGTGIYNGGAGLDGIVNIRY